jgi:hypothetical protein
VKRASPTTLLAVLADRSSSNLAFMFPRLPKP